MADSAATTGSARGAKNPRAPFKSYQWAPGPVAELFGTFFLLKYLFVI